jgi:hypothetical protein
MWPPCKSSNGPNSSSAVYIKSEHTSFSDLKVETMRGIGLLFTALCTEIVKKKRKEKSQPQHYECTEKLNWIEFK